MTAAPKRLYSPTESATYLGVSLTAFKDHVQPQLMPKAVYIGTRLCFDVKELDRWVDTQKGGKFSGETGSATSDFGTKARASTDPRASATRERLRRVPRTSMRDG